MADHSDQAGGLKADGMCDPLAWAETRAAAAFAPADAPALPLVLTRSGEAGRAALSEDLAAWASATGFEAGAGAVLFAPDPAAPATPKAALFGVGSGEPLDALEPPKALAGRAVRLEGASVDPAAAALAWAMGAYRFPRYADAKPAAQLVPASEAAREAALAEAVGVYLTRDLVNTPACDLGPEALEGAARALSARHGGKASVVVGAALLEQGYPMIHAVGRAAAQAPRLIDLVFETGGAEAPRVTLVGKGVCFDTGGLDIKPPRAMRLMKKDMGGAATALGLADMILRARLPVRLRVLIPAVENAVSADSFRPGDVLPSRKGLTVEVGDTDAEGRLVLADALTEADAESPDLLIDLATLTGAARVAVGPDLAPFYTADDGLAAELEAAARAARDPVWRMPLWDPYDAELSSKIADVGSVSTSGFAGSIAAALFLRRFVERAQAWAHFDIYAWSPKARPGRPEGGACQAARALLGLLKARYGDAAQ